MPYQDIYSDVVRFYEEYEATLSADAKAALLPTVEYARESLRVDREGRIKKSELKHGQYYAGRSTVACVARWNANHQRFFYSTLRGPYRKFGVLQHISDVTSETYLIFKPDACYNPHPHHSDDYISIDGEFHEG